MNWKGIFADREPNLKVELIAGLTSFLTSAYIIAVHPLILSQTGMDRNALIAVTCIASAVATLFMAAWPKVPVLMAPGMGLNAFFAITVVGTLGYSWQQALGFVFWAGVLFLALSLIGFREKIAGAIPENLRIAGSVGIGLFIAYLGLHNLGIIQTDPLGFPHLAKIEGTQILGLTGILIAGFLEAKKMRGSLLIAILVVTVLSMLFHFTAPPVHWLSAPPSIAPLAAQLEWIPPMKIETLIVILTFLYVALFDGLGTVLGVAEAAGISKDPDYNKKLSRMLTADSAANIAGALLGTSTVTAYIESNTGISQGGRTGWTAFFVAIFFLLALFAAPFFAVVPPYATASALIIVGVYMIRDISRIRFDSWDEGLPAFLTMILMPVTTSIAGGLMFGFLSYVILKLLLGKTKDLNPYLVGIAIFSLFNLIANGRLH